MVTKIDEVVAQASRIERSTEDLQLQSLAREQVLDLPPATRLRWFSIRPVMHAELERVACDVLELLEEDNDVSIIAVIGLSGVGKTTLAAAIGADLCDRFARDVAAGQMPVLYAEMRERTQDEIDSANTERRKAAVQEAETVVEILVSSGTTPSLRAASDLTGTKWYPSQLRAQSLMMLRVKLGDRRVTIPPGMASSSYEYRAMLELSSCRLRKALGFQASSAA